MPAGFFASKPDCEAVAISPSGKRVRIHIGENTHGKWRVYRNEEPFNWNITVGHQWDSRDEAIAFIEYRGWSVEIVE